MTIVRPNETFYTNRFNNPRYNYYKDQDWYVVESWPDIAIVRIAPVIKPDFMVDAYPPEIEYVTP